MQKEQMLYSDYMKIESRESRIIPGKLLKVEVFACPKCNKVHKGLEHRKPFQCECGLNMERTGNALMIWLNGD
jgi:hypothetical protein